MNNIQSLFLKNCADSGLDLDDICMDAGIEITCVSKDVPENIQWLFGWRWSVHGKDHRYCSGGVTKREVVMQLIKKGKAKLSAKIAIELQPYF